jgi:hypothetical protein
MPFFFIVPLWLLAVVIGAVMLSIGSARRAGIYVLTTSTFATAVSFLLSTAVLFVGPRVASDPPAEWFGLMVVAAYLTAIPIGGLTGAIAGFLITRELWHAHRLSAGPRQPPGSLGILVMPTVTGAPDSHHFETRRRTGSSASRASTTATTDRLRLPVTAQPLTVAE